VKEGKTRECHVKVRKSGKVLCRARGEGKNKKKKGLGVSSVSENRERGAEDELEAVEGRKRFVRGYAEEGTRPYWREQERNSGVGSC